MMEQRAIKKIKKIQDTIQFYQLFFKQMYIPFIDDKNKMEIDGKIFNPNKTDEEIDNDRYFGKHHFSKKVILPNYITINFEKFKPIFDNIQKIISLKI